MAFLDALVASTLGADDFSMSESLRPLPTALGRPAVRAFEAAGFRTLGDLDRISEAALLALHGVGPRAIKILREHEVKLAP